MGHHDMKKKQVWLALGAALSYILLINILLHAEKNWAAAGNPTSIHTMADAVWYSIVTLTTVGYGDKFPASPVGKIVGAVFLLLSLGILTMILSLAFSLMKGNLLPKVRLSWRRRKHWYVFHGASPENIALARLLTNETVVFLLQPGAEKVTVPGISIETSLQTLSKISKNGMTFFVLGDDDLENLRFSSQLEPYGKVYCCAQIMQARHASSIDCMDPAQTISRMYWNDHPLRPEERNIVLIGGSRWLPGLLCQALLVNVLDTAPGLRYHIFGDMTEFLADHRSLDCFCAINRELPGKDSLYFHSQHPDADVLAKADRVILCLDSDAENLSMLSRIQWGYPTHAALHIHLNQIVNTLPAVPFGAHSSLFTPENVLHHQLDCLAREQNERYNARCPEYATEWDALSDYAKGSNLAAADHLAVKVRLLLEDFSITNPTPEQRKKAAQIYRRQYDTKKEYFRKLEHLRWERYLYLNNWKSGETRDDYLRIHPLLRPYEELSDAEKAKDDDSWIGIADIEGDCQ